MIQPPSHLLPATGLTFPIIIEKKGHVPHEVLGAPKESGQPHEFRLAVLLYSRRLRKASQKAICTVSEHLV
jgi:hypothetical protein